MKNISELNPRGFPTSEIINKNLNELFHKIMAWQDVYMDEGGRPFVVTSGLRDEAFQNELIAQGKTKAKHSKHIYGAAVDLRDKTGVLGRWALENEFYFKQLGLYFEDPRYTKGWVHAQIMAPLSGKIFFIP